MNNYIIKSIDQLRLMLRFNNRQSFRSKWLHFVPLFLPLWVDFLSMYIHCFIMKHYIVTLYQTKTFNPGSNWKNLQTLNWRLVKFCGRICPWRSRKQCGKRRKCWLKFALCSTGLKPYPTDKLHHFNLTRPPLFTHTHKPFWILTSFRNPAVLRRNLKIFL